MMLALAMVLDAVFGEPKWLWDRAPHPAVILGRVISWLEARMNQGRRRGRWWCCWWRALGWWRA